MAPQFVTLQVFRRKGNERATNGALRACDFFLVSNWYHTNQMSTFRQPTINVYKFIILFKKIGRPQETSHQNGEMAFGSLTGQGKQGGNYSNKKI